MTRGVRSARRGPWTSGTGTHEGKVTTCVRTVGDRCPFSSLRRSTRSHGVFTRSVHPDVRRPGPFTSFSSTPSDLPTSSPRSSRTRPPSEKFSRHYYVPTGNPRHTGRGRDGDPTGSVEYTTSHSDRVRWDLAEGRDYSGGVNGKASESRKVRRCLEWRELSITDRDREGSSCTGGPVPGPHT